MKKNIIALLLAALLALSLCACGGKTQPDAGAADPDGAQIANPVTESSAGDILTTLGISFNIPERASDTAYYIIDMGDGPSIAEARFTLDGVNCTYRITSSDGLEDISGMYYDWAEETPCDISGCTGMARFNSGAEGVCFWYDAAPGLLYCVSAGSDASEDYLISLAEYLYSPMQGDADGDAPADGEPPADAEEPADPQDKPEEAEGQKDDAAEAPGSTEEGEAIAKTAADQTGKAFEWGKSGPDTFDNSGFVQFCLSENGIQVGRTTGEIYAKGDEVKQEDLRAGDVVFFTYEDDGSPSYCGVYVGDGKFIAASNESTPVGAVDMTDEHYQQRFVGAHRYA